MTSFAYRMRSILIFEAVGCKNVNSSSKQQEISDLFTPFVL